MDNGEGIHSPEFKIKILKYHRRMKDLLDQQAMDPDRLDLETLQTGVEMLMVTISAIRNDGVQAVPSHKIHALRDPVHLLGDLFTLMEEVVSASESILEDLVN